MTSGPAAYRRLQARHSTWFAVAGGILVLAGVLLTLAEVGGNVLPTILALAGIGLFIAGMAIGTRLVVDNFRFRRDQSYYDDDDDR